MRALAGDRLLIAWDLGLREQPLERALTLLELALPGMSRAELAALSIAERNRRLLQLRALSFGMTLDAYARCPQCAESMEFSMPVATLLDTMQAPTTDCVEWREHGCSLRMRLVTTLDLLAILDADSDDEAQTLLLARCLSVDGEPATRPDINRADAARDQFERLHEAARWSCTVACPHCSGSAALELDIVQFLWLEVRDAARGLLGEIHTLARHYGWSERSIVQLPVERRRAYLDLIVGENA
jgi:hypothetical protein